MLKSFYVVLIVFASSPHPLLHLYPLSTSKQLYPVRLDENAWKRNVSSQGGLVYYLFMTSLFVLMCHICPF